MAEVLKELTLDVFSANRIKAIVAKQYDYHSRYLLIRLTDGGNNINVESGSVVTINAFRPDGDSAAFLGSVEADGRVLVPLAYWMLELEGTVKCDVSVVDDNERKLSSINFQIEVERANYSGDDIEPDEHYDLLVELLAEVAQAQEAEIARVAAETARVTAENGRVSAETARDTAETARASAEGARSSAETARGTAETARASAETTRQSNEADRVSAEAARVLAETAREEAEEEREQALKDYAKIDGFYEGMTVGHAIEAKAIATDREIEDADEACPPITFGAVGGNAEVQDGYSAFKELRGNTVVWNQLIKKDNLRTSDSGTNFTMSRDSNSLTCAITVTDTIVAETRCQIGINKVNTFVYIPTGHKYLFKTNNTNPNIIFENGINGSVRISNSGIVTQPANVGGRIFPCVVLKPELAVGTYTITINIFDLTLMFGEGNEPSTVEEFTSQFPNPYYDYNAGQLLSSKSASMILRGRNQWDEEWEVGEYDSNGEKIDSTTQIRSKNKIKVIPSTYYTFTTTFELSGASYYGRVYFYDSLGNFISPRGFWRTDYNQQILAPQNACYMAFDVRLEYGSTYNDNICVYICYDTPNLPYVPYEEQVVTLPNIELKSAGSAYDVAYQEGGGKRRIGSVDLGTLNYSECGSTETVTQYYSSGLDSLAKKLGQGICPRFTLSSSKDVNTFYIGNDNNGNFYIRTAKDQYESASAFQTAMDGVILYYELATETDITTEENPGWTELVKINNFGTIEFTTSSVQNPQVPQAYFIRYTVNLVEFLDSVYVEAEGDAKKIALKSDIVIPPAPTTDGNYVLKVSVVSGTPTYSWEAEQ